MAQTMIASDECMSDGQIDELMAKVRAAARKNAHRITKAHAQAALGISNIGQSIFGEFARIAHAAEAMFSRRVKVHSDVPFHNYVSCFAGEIRGDTNILYRVPVEEESDQSEVIFFKIETADGFLNDRQLEDDYKLRGLIPADPRSLIVANIDDPTLLVNYPHVTHWKDSAGKWGFANFLVWNGKSTMNIGYRFSEWPTHTWWFAGVRMKGDTRLPVD